MYLKDRLLKEIEIRGSLQQVECERGAKFNAVNLVVYGKKFWATAFSYNTDTNQQILHIFEFEEQVKEIKNVVLVEQKNIGDREIFNYCQFENMIYFFKKQKLTRLNLLTLQETTIDGYEIEEGTY